MAKAIKVAPVKKGKGSPTKYKAEYAEQVYKLCLLGATDVDIADFFGVVEKTVNNWKTTHSDFLQSIKRGKILADSNVADRLYQRALGFEHDSEEIKVVEGSIERVKIRKIYAPDPTSAIFWLKNRQSKMWRDKQEIDHTTAGQPIVWQEVKNYDTDQKAD